MLVTTRRTTVSILAQGRFFPSLVAGASTMDRPRPSKAPRLVPPEPQQEPPGAYAAGSGSLECPVDGTLAQAGEKQASRWYLFTQVTEDEVRLGRKTPSGSWILDPGSWILDPGSWILDPGFWILDPGSWILDPGFWIMDPGSWILDSGFWILVPGFWMLDSGSWILDLGS
jgi:hypothetical protein